MSYKQTIISSAIAMTVFNEKNFLLHIPTVDENRELHVDFGVKRSKVNLPATFCLHLFSDRISLDISARVSSYFVHRSMTMKERCL